MEDPKQLLSATYELLKSIADTVPVLIWTTDINKKFIFFNVGWSRFTGRTIEQEYGNGWTAGIHPDDLQRYQITFTSSFNARKEFRVEYRLRRHDDIYRWVTDSGAPRYATDGTFIGYVGSCMDIEDLLDSERKEIEDVTAEAARKEQALFEEVIATNEKLRASNEELASINKELEYAQEELRSLNLSLEGKVTERTKALTKSEAEARGLNEELASTNEDLAATNNALVSANEELLEAKAKAERGERIFRNMARNIPGSLVILMNPDHRYLAIEGDLMLQLGYDSSDYTGKHPTEVAHPERYEANKPLFDRMFAGERFRTERIGDDEKVYQIDLVPLHDDENEIYAGLIIALDITDHRQSEERSAKLAAIVESSDDAIIGKDLNGIVTSWNRGAELIFGYKEAEIVGRSILTVIPEDRQHEEPIILGKLREGNKIDHYETIRQAKDGKLINVSLTISPIHDKEGRVIGVSKIARDITEQKRDEQRKNDFIGMVSHELKTPLTSLSAILQIASMKPKAGDDSFLCGAMQKAVQQVKRMTAMINGFLNVSRLESGKIIIEKQAFNMGELIEEVIDETRITGSTHDISFVPCNAIEVVADRNKISSVLTNLIGNSIKYSPKGSSISVECKARDTDILVTVKDEGIGIKPEDANRIFERYYRVQTPNMQHISGFGIGLYLTAEIVQRHHGHIGVDSEYKKGSTFYFTLPL